MVYRVLLTAQADRDLEQILRFLAQKNTAAAERLGYALLDDALSLAQLPNRGVALRSRPGHRRVLHGRGSSFSIEWMRRTARCTSCDSGMCDKIRLVCRCRFAEACS
jgi:plasmid stabilization system protein ParE